MDDQSFKKHLTRKIIVGSLYAVLAVGVCVGVAIGNSITKQYEGSITSTLCYTAPSGSAAKSADKGGAKLAEEIEREGIVLAKNNDGLLPLKKAEVKKINVFGHSAIDWMISNSGSGSAGPNSGETAWGIINSLQDYGVEVNMDIINYYNSWVPARSLPFSIQSGYDSLYRLAEPSLTESSGYKALYDQAKTYSDTAIVCLSRTAGEHIDVPHTQINNINASGSGSHKDNNRGYLQISAEEEQLLKAVGKDFDKVIVILNATNVMECDFLKDEVNFPGLDSVLIVGATGTVGAKAIPPLIFGDYSPSGRTADTYPMKHQYNITYYTNGHEMSPYYTNAPSGANLRSMNSSGGAIDTINFAPYIEGIYVGYKWFETADAEGYWDAMGGYDKIVAFPFGFGLNYTTFSWEIVDSNPAANSEIRYEDDMTINVRVTNTGDRAGRDVVEVYLTAPYTKNGIEKSSVKLVGYQKTPNLAPGDNVVLPITVHGYDFASYDCYDKNGNGNTGYEMDAGNYVLKLMRNSHEMKENMAGGNTLTYKVSDTINCLKDTVTGTEVKNLFTGDKAVDGIACDGSNANQNIEYITRANFRALPTERFPSKVWDNALSTSLNKEGHNAPNAYSRQDAAAWDNAKGKDAFGKDIPTTNPTWGVEKNLRVYQDGKITELGLKLGANYDDPEWNDLLDQCTIEDSMRIVNNSESYYRPGVPSVGLKSGNSHDFVDAEGASQVGVAQGSSRPRLTAYPTPTVQAQCWNPAMSYAFGKSEAKDMAALDDDALYGPASNLHRSPYGGRNSEYHSEDPILAGICLAGVTKGLADGGKQGFMKHFCCNDTEYHRVGLYTWLTEQALRENYLRVFEEAVKRGESTAVMTSFNRVGATWAGGSEAMIQGVLRNEWGFKGMIITDMIESSDLMDISQHFRAGANYVLGGSGYTTGSANTQPTAANSTPRLQWRMRENLKQVIYAHIRVLYLNDEYNKNPSSGETIVVSSTKAPWVWWKPALLSIEIVLLTGVFFGLFAVIYPHNPEFRAAIGERIKGRKGNKEGR